MAKYSLEKAQEDMRERWSNGREGKEVHRFAIGETVWVRDRGRNGGGVSLEEAIVLERHYHPDRHPYYPNGEGYVLDGELWWSCYSGCRVFKTREEVSRARLNKIKERNND